MTIYSDRSGDKFYSVFDDDGDTLDSMESDNVADAKREAETDFRLNFGKDGMR